MQANSSVTRKTHNVLSSSATQDDVLPLIED
jgi:hypothetical protein